MSESKPLGQESTRARSFVTRPLMIETAASWTQTVRELVLDDDTQCQTLNKPLSDLGRKINSVLLWRMRLQKVSDLDTSCRLHKAVALHPIPCLLRGLQTCIDEWKDAPISLFRYNSCFRWLFDYASNVFGRWRIPVQLWHLRKTWQRR